MQLPDVVAIPSLVLAYSRTTGNVTTETPLLLPVELPERSALNATVASQGSYLFEIISEGILLPPVSPGAGGTLGFSALR